MTGQTCCAHKADGTACGAPAIAFDLNRDGYVCGEHNPHRGTFQRIEDMPPMVPGIKSAHNPYHRDAGAAADREWFASRSEEYGR